jgi:hypothetical protein
VNLFIGQFGTRDPSHEPTGKDKASDRRCQYDCSDSHANQNLIRRGIGIGSPILNQPAEKYDNADYKRQNTYAAQTKSGKALNTCGEIFGLLHAFWSLTFAINGSAPVIPETKSQRGRGVRSHDVVSLLSCRTSLHGHKILRTRNSRAAC